MLEQKADVQKQILCIVEKALHLCGWGRICNSLCRLSCVALCRLQALEFMEDHGDGVAEVQRGIGGIAMKRHHALAETSFVVGETSVFAPKHHGDGAVNESLFG